MRVKVAIRAQFSLRVIPVVSEDFIIGTDPLNVVRAGGRVRLLSFRSSKTRLTLAGKG